MKKIIATIEARMTSTRLPGKPLLKIKNFTVLEYLVNRLKYAPSISDIVLATTTNDEDDPLVKLAKKINVNVFRGSETNVMDRVIKAAESIEGDLIVQITGDCPLIDPRIIEETIKIYNTHDVDYVSNTIKRCYPDGMDTQVYSLKTLKKSASMTKDPLDQEHVSLHIRNNPKIFKHLHLLAPPELFWPSLGLTLDEKGDYLLIKKIIENLHKKNNIFSCFDIINFLKKNPKYLKLNAYVKRKGNT